MGHSTIQMTMRYAHLAPNSGREFIALLDERTANTLPTAREVQDS